jgi:hypothetical protein
MKKQKPLTHSASCHPAKVGKPLRRPDDRQGFNQAAGSGLQSQRCWAERDAPLSERKDRG